MTSDISVAGNPINTSQVLVPENKLPEFHDRLAKLNKKGLSYGLTPIKATLSKVKRYYEKVDVIGSDSDIIVTELVELRTGHLPPTQSQIIHLHCIDLEYPIIKLGNWQVIAKRESIDSGTLLFTITDNEDDLREAANIHDCKMGCDHCKTNRQRNDTFILKNEDNEYKQIGSSCLEVYTGIDPASALFLAKMYSFVKVSIDDPAYSLSSSSVHGMCTQHYLARVAYLISTEGFISAKNGRESGLLPTYQDAMSPIRDNRYNDNLTVWEAEAQKIIEYVRETAQQAPKADTFIHNVATILNNDDIEFNPKYLAFAAAGANTALKAIYAPNKDQTLQSSHVSAIGENIETEVHIYGIHSWPSQYGVIYRINMKDKAGNQFSWKTGSPPQALLEAPHGKPFLTKFKIKAHGEFNNQKTNDVSHLKFRGWVEQLNDINQLTDSTENSIDLFSLDLSRVGDNISENSQEPCNHDVSFQRS